MKKFTAMLLTFLTALTLVLCVSACKSDEPVIAVTQITLSKTQLTLTEGDEETVTATVLPDGADKTVEWTSSDESVAKVENGKITAVSAGTADITAKAGEKSAVCKVEVKEAKLDYTGNWNPHKFVIEGVTYIVGTDDEKMKEDLELDDGLLISESYKIKLNGDGTGEYTEEWGPVPCTWAENANGVSLTFENAYVMELTYADGILAMVDGNFEVYFKK